MTNCDTIFLSIWGLTELLWDEVQLDKSLRPSTVPACRRRSHSPKSQETPNPMTYFCHVHKMQTTETRDVYPHHRSWAPLSHVAVKLLPRSFPRPSARHEATSNSLPSCCTSFASGDDTNHEPRTLTIPIVARYVTGTDLQCILQASVCGIGHLDPSQKQPKLLSWSLNPFRPHPFCSSN